MNTGLATFLTRAGADAPQLQHAVRYFIAECTDDLPPEDMRERMLGGLSNRADLDRVLQLLQTDSDLLDAAILCVLQFGWSGDSTQSEVRGAVDDAKTKLPVVEPAVIAIAAMYGLWLVRTGGLKKHEHVVRRKEDGTYEESDVKEWWGPSGPLRAIASLITGFPSAQLEPEDEAVPDHDDVDDDLDEPTS